MFEINIDPELLGNSLVVITQDTEAERLKLAKNQRSNKRLLNQAAKRLYEFISSDEGQALREILGKKSQRIVIGYSYEHVYFLSYNMGRRTLRSNRNSSRYFNSRKGCEEVLGDVVKIWQDGLTSDSLKIKLLDIFKSIQTQADSCIQKTLAQ